MKARYRLIQRGIRGGGFYCVDTKTGKRTSLGTTDKDAATQILFAKNQAERQPMLNLQLAKAYLQGSDSAMNARTWGAALESLVETKLGANKLRWQTFQKDKAMAPLLEKVLVQTEGELLLKTIRRGTVSTNVFLRRLHNFCVDMNWLPWPLVPQAAMAGHSLQGEEGHHWGEHGRIVERELNPERKAFYQLAWHLGASQSDLANLHAEDLDWSARVISFFRQKTRWRGQQPPQIRFGKEVEAVEKGGTHEQRERVYADIEQWSEIRRRVLVEGVSRRQVQRETGMHGRTLAKILKQSEPPGYRQGKARGRPKLGAYLERIEEILKQDASMPRKQRHTAKRIWDRLKEW